MTKFIPLVNLFRPLYHGKQQRYKADYGQSVYQINRRHCGRKSDFLKKFNQLLGKQIYKPAGKPTLVPDDDPRANIFPHSKKALGNSVYSCHLPESVPRVKKIFDLAVHGRGAASITRILVEEKVPTPGWLFPPALRHRYLRKCRISGNSASRE